MINQDRYTVHMDAEKRFLTTTWIPSEKENMYRQYYEAKSRLGGFSMVVIYVLYFRRIFPFYSVRILGYMGGNILPI